LDLQLGSGFILLPGLADQQPQGEVEAGTRCTKLLEKAFARRPPSEIERQGFLKVASAAAKKRTGEILSKKLRGAYERAALLAVAYAEACTVAGDQQTGMRLIEGLLSDFSRFYAYRREMEALLRSSPLLPNPAAKRR
ncbi:MAG: hypothetical protein V3T83_12310, partial [Acidobacteriota bacterium]